MNKLASIDPAVRAERMGQTTFDVFQISEPVKNRFNVNMPDQRTYALGSVQAANPDEARTKALEEFAFCHKQQLIIREFGPRGILLHIYAIVRKPDVWVWRDHVQHREQRLDTKLLCVMDGAVLAGVALLRAVR